MHFFWFAVVVIAFVAGAMKPGSNQGVNTGKKDLPGNAPAKNSGHPPLSALGNSVKTRVSETGKIDNATNSRLDLPGGQIPGRLVSGAGRPLSNADIERLGELMTKNSNPVQRRIAFSRMLRGLTAENALTIREQIKSLHPESSEFKDFHYAWGAIDGAHAVLNGAKTREVDMAVTMAGWASAEPENAFNWFAHLPEGDRYNREELKIAMIGGMADTNPATATGYTYQLAEAGDKQAERMLRTVASRVLHAEGPVGASIWAENLPDGSLRAAAMDRVAHDYVISDPPGAAAWAERFADEAHGARVIDEVGEEWAERDPVAAVNWLNSLSASEGKTAGLSSAFGEWARLDPQAASEHLIAMPESPERDSAINGFTRNLAPENPEAAIAWAGEITDAGTREGALIRAGQAMFRHDANGARTWLATSGLPPAAQQQVVNPPQRRR